MDLLYVKRITGLHQAELAEILNTTVDQVDTWLVDDSTIDEAAWSRLVQEFDYASDWLAALGLGWDNVASVPAVRRRLGITEYTLDTLLKQRKIEPIDFGVLGQWLTDVQVTACRQLPAK